MDSIERHVAALDGGRVRPAGFAATPRDALVAGAALLVAVAAFGAHRGRA